MVCRNRVCTILLVCAMAFRSGAAVVRVGDALSLAGTPSKTTAESRRTITLSEFKDKLQGSWIGQLVGVQWGVPTEMKFPGRIVPHEKVPVWEPELINIAFDNDDLWPEVFYMSAMLDHGVNCSWETLGEYYGKSTWKLWSGQVIARDHLRAGMKAPWTGHYSNNKACDLLSWHITSDFVGNICPGLPEAAMDIAWRCGHVTQFGDGVYGGTVPVMMHVTAFFAEDVEEIIQAGRLATPEGSKYREAIEDVIALSKEYPDDWTKTWNKFHQKWWSHNSRGWGRENWNIMTTYNGPFILIGLLYGNGDFEQSMRIAMRCGMDSDNPISTVGGILGTWLGASKIPDKWKSALNRNQRFASKDENKCMTYQEAVDASVKLAREVVLKSGGKITGKGGDEVWYIPIQEFKPLILEQRPAKENKAPELTAKHISTDGLSVALEASAADNDGIKAYQWFFGDLSYSPASMKSATVTHTYRRPGSYLAICYVTDRIGNTSWKAVQVIVGEQSG